MAEAATSVDLDRSDRAYLEVALARLARAGHIPPKGERHVEIRIDDHGRLRWIEARRIRIPASELEPGEDGL